jgi:hypothetical protein
MAPRRIIMDCRPNPTATYPARIPAPRRRVPNPAARVPAPPAHVPPPPGDVPAHRVDIPTNRVDAPAIVGDAPPSPVDVNPQRVDAPPCLWRCNCRLAMASPTKMVKGFVLLRATAIFWEKYSCNAGEAGDYNISRCHVCGNGVSVMWGFSTAVQ